MGNSTTNNKPRWKREKIFEVTIGATCSRCRSPGITYFSQGISFWVQVKTTKKKIPLWTRTTVSRCPTCSGRKIYSVWTKWTVGNKLNSRNSGYPWDRLFVRWRRARKQLNFWSRTGVQIWKYCCGNIASFSLSGIAKSAGKKQNVVLSQPVAKRGNNGRFRFLYLTKNSGVNLRTFPVGNGTKFSRRLHLSGKRLAPL